MSLVVAWLVFPLLLFLLSLGAGLLVERVSGRPLPGALVLPLGLALIIVASGAATYRGLTAEAATPLVIVLAVAGFAVSRERLRAFVPDPWPAAAAAGVFFVFAAPIVLSGEATFAGYTVLGDNSIHFMLIDNLMQDGRDVSGLETSSYQVALQSYFGSAYPVAAQAALGAVRPLVGTDVAWVYQPFLAFCVAMTALCLYALLSPFVESRPLRAVIAFLGAQPALVYAYYLQGGIKEIATVLVIALLFALVPTVLDLGGGVRRLIPLALASAAGLGVLGLAIVPWLGPLLLACAAALVWVRRPDWLRPTAREAAFFAAATIALSFPVIAEVGDYTRAVEKTVTTQSEFGNLIAPLDDRQASGIWPTGDYRLPLDATHLEYGHLLIGIALAGGALGLLWAVRRRAWLLLLYAAVSAVGWAYVTARGSPWADAKALAIVSTPAVVVFGLGAAALFSSRRRIEAVLLVGAIGAGVLWSNALAYHDVQLAPRDRLEELRSIGKRIEGRGPTLYVEFEEYAKHFLRDARPVGWSEAWQQPGAPTGRFGFPGDMDDVRLSYARRFRTLVLRRSPSSSRPPSQFRRTFHGRFYDTWERGPSPDVLAHQRLGRGLQPSARPSCSSVRRLGRRAERVRGRLAYVPRARRIVLSPAKAKRRPPAWTVDVSDPNAVHVQGQGAIDYRFRVSRTGPFEIWLQGSFGRPTSLAVDGRGIGSVRYALNGPRQLAYIGRAELTRGEHRVSLFRAGGSPRPGNGGDRLLGPVVISPEPAEAEGVKFARAGNWASLCDRTLDWVELVRR